MDKHATGLLFGLAAIWGASFVFVRVAAPEVGALIVADTRVLLAGLFLWLFCWTRRQVPRLRRDWRSYAVLGLFNAALQFALMAYAATRLSAALTAVLVATMPLWSAVIAPMFSKERLSRLQTLGLLIGFVGVVWAIGPARLDADSLLSVLAGLGSALAGAIGGNYARITHIEGSAMDKTIGQQLAAGIMLLPFAIVAAPDAWPPLTVIAALLALALLSTGLAFVIYFQLIQRIGATRTLTVEFLVPVFAGLWGWLLINEAITLQLVVGGIFVLFGSSLVNGWQPRLPWVSRDYE